MRSFQTENRPTRLSRRIYSSDELGNYVGGTHQNEGRGDWVRSPPCCSVGRNLRQFVIRRFGTRVSSKFQIPAFNHLSALRPSYDAEEEPVVARFTQKGKRLLIEPKNRPNELGDYAGSKPKMKAGETG